MNEEIFSSLEIDTIGEIMNISMGSAATAASTLLDNKVTITTPRVRVVSVDDFEITGFEPAIAVNIRYVEGIIGDNILILKKEDIRTILSQMMMTEMPEDFEIDMMAESAICELMNQMMGSSATVLSCFLGRTINISTPTTVPIDGLTDFKREHFGENKILLLIEFVLTIKDMMESTFMSVMQIDLAKEIIGTSLNFDNDNFSDDLVNEQTASAPPMPAPASPAVAAPPPPAAAPQQAPAPQQAYAPPPPPEYAQPQSPPPGYPPVPPAYAQQPYYPPYPYYPPAQQFAPPPGEAVPPVMVQHYNYSGFGRPAEPIPEAPANLDLVMAVPVTVTVELGRTRRKIKEILEFGQGTIVELDKQAGSSVDVIVNGQLIARGDVVVVDDNFSIRITEILKARDALSLL